MSRNHDNFADLITFTRASRGTSVRHVRYGDDLVTEGSHTSIGSDWSFSSGVYGCSGGQTSGQTIVRFSNIGIVQGSQYFISLQVSNLTTGSLGVKLNGTSSESAASNGTFNFTIVGVDNDGFQLVEQSSFDGDVSNISVKKVTLDDTADPLLIFNHADNIPRIDFDPVTKDRKGFLIEEARTNAYDKSEDFTSSTFFLSSSTTTSDQGTAPDGTNNADKVVPNNGASSCFLLKNVTVSSGDTHTLSVFAKADGLNFIQITGSNGFPTDHQNYNLSTGALASSSSSLSSSIEDFGNGWYRIALTLTATSSISDARLVIGLLTGDDGRLDSDGTSTPNGTDGVLLFGAQFEEGAFPTSYIPTSGATATRAADVASINTSAFGYNQDEGTFLAEASTFDGSGSAKIVFIATSSSAQNTDRFMLFFSSSEALKFEIETGDVQQANIVRGTGLLNSFEKMAAAYQENNSAFAITDLAALTDTSCTIPTNTILRFGTFTGTSNFLNGHIKKFQYFPRRLSDTQLQEITR